MSRNVLLLDFDHLVGKYVFNKNLRPASPRVVSLNGAVVRLTPTLTSYIGKRLCTLSKCGAMETSVIFGGQSARGLRSSFFADLGYTYAVNNSSFSDAVKNDIAFFRDVLQFSGVSINYNPAIESKDYIYTIVKTLREQDADVRISILTGCSALLPLVDDLTTVYLSSSFTVAEDGVGEIDGYRAITPSSFTDYLAFNTYRDYNLPFNCYFLLLLLCGDARVGLKFKLRFGASNFNALVAVLQEQGVDFATSFKSDTSLSSILDVLSLALPLVFNKPMYCDAVLSHIRRVYEGVRLSVVQGVNMPSCFSRDVLQTEYAKLGVMLPRK